MFDWDCTTVILKQNLFGPPKYYYIHFRIVFVISGEQGELCLTG